MISFVFSSDFCCDSEVEKGPERPETARSKYTEFVDENDDSCRQEPHFQIKSYVIYVVVVNVVVVVVDVVIHLTCRSKAVLR